MSLMKRSIRGASLIWSCSCPPQRLHLSAPWLCWSEAICPSRGACRTVFPEAVMAARASLAREEVSQPDALSMNGSRCQNGSPASSSSTSPAPWVTVLLRLWRPFLAASF